MADRPHALDSLFAEAERRPGLSLPAVLLPTRRRPLKWPAGRTALAVPPGDEPFDWPDLAEPHLRNRANGYGDCHRIVLLADPSLDERTALARMSWALELSSQWETSPDLLEFGLFVARAVAPRYLGRGPGSECAFQRMPSFRDANAAAAETVAAVLGGEAAVNHFAHDASLPRPLGPPDRASLARRLVVFAFMHHADAAWRALEEGTTLEDKLESLDPHAPLWWRRLAADPSSARSPRRLASLIPDAEAIARAGEPVKAWWDLVARLDLHEHHGLSVLRPLA